MRFVTNGEVQTLAAIVLGLNPEEIDSFVLIIRGECPNCPKRDAISIASTPGITQEEIIALTTDGITTLLTEDK